MYVVSLQTILAQPRLQKRLNDTIATAWRKGV